MMDNNIEFTDIEDLDQVSSEGHARQIKTRNTSFNSILGAWNRFLLNHYNNKLDKMKEEIVTDKFKVDSEGKLSDNSINKIEKKSEAIARLEEKIKILSLDDVPSNYVSERKIKLRDNMMANLTFNSRNAYSVGINKMDKVFENNTDIQIEQNDKIESDDSLNVAALPAEESYSGGYSSDPSHTLNEDAIAAILKESVASLGESVQKTLDEDALNSETSAKDKPIRDDIQIVPTDVVRNIASNVIDEKFEEVDSNDYSNRALSTTPEEEKESTSSINITPEDVRNSVEDAFKSVEMRANAKVIDSDTVNEVVNGKIENVNLDDVSSVQNTENVDSNVVINEESNNNLDASDVKNIIDNSIADVKKVSRNNSYAAKLSRFDNDGKRKEKYNYTPMTDDEIAAARENIEYDKYEKIYSNENKTKNDEDIVKNENPVINFPTVNFNEIFNPANNDSTVVHTDTDSVDEYSFVEDGDNNNNNNNLTFDFSDATPNDFNYAAENLKSVDDFVALKKQIESLKEKQAASKKRAEDAVKAQQQAAKKAADAKKKAAESSEAYNKMLEHLRDYYEALQEDCDYNNHQADIAEQDAECNERFIDTQNKIASSNMKLINEMNELISSEAANVQVRNSK
jgi:hypothetical protein